MADTYGESYGGATGLTGWATEAVVCGVQHLRDRKEPVGWQVCSFGGWGAVKWPTMIFSACLLTSPPFRIPLS